MYQEPPQEKIHSVIKLFANSKKQEAIDKVNALIKDYPKSSLLLNLVGTELLSEMAESARWEGYGSF